MLVYVLVIVSIAILGALTYYAKPFYNGVVEFFMTYKAEIQKCKDEDDDFFSQLIAEKPSWGSIWKRNRTGTFR